MDTVYLAPEGHVKELTEELAGVLWVEERLVCARGTPQDSAWAQNTWLDPRILPGSSIGEGARNLRSIQRNWVLHSVGHHRRAKLIQEKLPPIRFRPLEFGDPVPEAPLGSWTLLDRDRILAAPRCTSPFPDGEVRFVENRRVPPTRAYLKLWEALTLAGRRPGPGDRCLDLGSCPGGWTWVLHELGAGVVSVDRSGLAPTIASLPRVDFRRGDAFALTPEETGPVDWLCSDVICYPGRLLELVHRWMESGMCRNFVCTIKFQGETDHGITREFAAIPGSRVRHLFHNKHELTWMRLAS